MANRTHAEVQETFAEVVPAFQGLYKKDDYWRRYYTGKWQEDLLAKVKDGGLIPDEFLQKRAVISYDVRKAVGLRKGKLTRAFDIHCEPDDERKAARADEEEETEDGWLTDMGLDAASQLWSSIYEVQSIWKVGPLWRNRNEFALPTQDTGEKDVDWNNRCDAYRKKFKPYSLGIRPLRTSAWNEEDMQGTPQVNLALCTYEIPYADLFSLYGQYDRNAQRNKQDHQDLMLKIGSQQFPWLRGDEYLPKEWASGTRKRATVREVSDGVYRTVHVQGLNDRGRASGDWQEIACYDEETGRPAMYLVYGAYHPGAELEDRYEGIDQTLMQWLRTRDYHLSFKASYVASATPDAFVVPAVGVAEWLQTPTDQRPTVNRAGNGQMTAMIGEPTSLIASPDQLKHNDDGLQVANQMVEKFWPSSLLNNGVQTATLIERGTLGGIARGVEEEESGQQEAVDCAVRLVGDLLQDVRQGYKTRWTKLLSKATPVADDEDEPTTEDDFEFQRVVSARDTRLSTQEMQGAAADRQFFRPEGFGPSITEEQWFERNGTTNVTEQKVQLNAEKQHRLRNPAIYQDYDDFSTQYLAEEMGIDPQLASQHLGVNVDASPPSQQGAGQQGTEPLRQQFMQSAGSQGASQG